MMWTFSYFSLTVVGIKFWSLQGKINSYLTHQWLPSIISTSKDSGIHRYYYTDSFKYKYKNYILQIIS